MSPSSDEQREEFRKRLTHLALREVIGGDAPPDLSDRILAAAEEPLSELPQPKGEEVMDKPRKSHTARWILVTNACTAALFVVAILAINGSRARSLAILDRNEALVAEKTQTGPVESSESSAERRSHAVPWQAIAAAPDFAAPSPDDSIATVPGESGAGPATGGQPVPAPQQVKNWLPARSPSGPQGRPQPASNSAGGYGGLYGDYEEEYGGGYGEEYGSMMGYGGAAPVNDPSAEMMGGYGGYGGYGGGGEGYGEEDMGYGFGMPASPSTQPGYVAQQNTARSLANNSPASTALPSPWYMTDDVQYFPPGDEFRLKREAEALRQSGQGPGRGGDQYVRLVENPFRAVKDHAYSTFSIDVDTASYANVRRFLLQDNQLPPPDAVRIEELVNYFDYDYSGPTSDAPFASHIELAGCPWAPENRLARIALKGYEIETNQRPPSNLVFLLDVSGSMSSNDKLPLLQSGMKLLAGQLSENDRVAIVVYAGSEGLVLPSTVGDEREKVLDAIDRLKSGGSTNGGAGIELAYKIAQEQFIEEGVNRVILCTDGDFNVGTTSTGDLERMVEEKAKSGVFLSVLGFGRGNLNDAMMETISNKGNGNYAYIDSINEAQKVLVEQMGGTLITIAKDVKIQIEFNPTQVEAYRLIGYENRILAKEDFNDDKKDAGEIGAGHTVTALYELVPAGGKVELPNVDPLRYQVAPSVNQNEDVAGEMFILRLRYKQPDGDTSELLEFPVTYGDASFSNASPDFQFAAGVASFGMLLRNSAHRGMSTYEAALEIAQSVKGPDKHGYRAEFVQMVQRAKAIVGPTQPPATPQEPDADSADAEPAEDGLTGVVLATKPKALVEISLGSDDGLIAGHQLDAYRIADGVSTYLGKVEVIEITPDKAVCKVLRQFRKGVIQTSDRVTTDLQEQ